MNIKWHRIAGVTLIGLAVYIFCKISPFMNMLFDKINAGYGYEKLKVIALLLMCALLVTGVVLIFMKN